MLFKISITIAWRHHGYHHIFILPMARFMSSLISKHPISVIRQMLCKIDQLLMLATVSKIIAYH